MTIYHQNETRPRGFTESYEVKYWGQKGETEFKEQKTVIYYTTSKSAHKQVKAKFKQDYKCKDSDIVSISYQ